MLNVKKFIVNPLKVNCYVVSDDTNECVIIDCGAWTVDEYNEVADYIKNNNLKPIHLLLTHAHLDHACGNKFIENEFGLKAEVHLKDADLMKRMDEQCQRILGMPLPYAIPDAGRYFTEKDAISFGNHEFSIMETPGHSPGSVFFICKEEKVAFSGDTLFRGSIGRTDFMGGSMFQIIQSLRMVCQLPDDITVYPGHGEETTIGYECATNMYLDR